MDGCFYLKEMIANLFDELDKQPERLQLELISTLEGYLNDWKSKNQILRDIASDQSQTDLESQQSLVKEHDVTSSETKREDENDGKEERNDAVNDTAIILSTFMHKAMTTEISDQHFQSCSGVVQLLNSDHNIDDQQIALATCSTRSHNCSLSMDCKVETQQGKVNTSCVEAWTHHKFPDTVNLSGDKVDADTHLSISNNNLSNGCDGEDFKMEPQNEDGVSINAHSGKNLRSRPWKTQQQLSGEEKRRSRGKRKTNKTDDKLSHQQLTVCEICGACVKIIKVHMMQHGERLHTCPYCSYTSHQRGTVDVHVRRIHTNDRPHLCEICGKGFVKSSLLKDHISVKHSQVKRERSFVCLECNFSTYTQTLLHTHIINRHKPYRRQIYKCEQCDAQLCSAHSLKEHVNLCHTNERPFPCSMCDFAAKSAKRLKNHMIYHSEKAFKCDTCGKMFYTRPQLKRHHLVHTRTTDFSCPHCNYQCSLAENLRKHCQAIHRVTYPAKKRHNYRREFPKPKQPKQTAEHLEETVAYGISLQEGHGMINCSA